MVEPPALDPDQLVVVGAPSESRVIVTAPPGSGKTEVVARRLLHLVDDEELEPFDEILVISFSRAAVAAVQARSAARLGSAGSAIRTIDSLASLILDELGVEGWEGKDYDARVGAAASAVTSEGLPPSLDGLRHLIIDEVQDVVGVRAKLLLEIIKRLPPTVGLTALGDPNQGIFDFQISGKMDELTSADFLTLLASLVPTETNALHGQYRATADEPRKAIALAETPIEARPAATRTFISHVLVAGSVRDLAVPMSRWRGTTALLCRTNGDALVAAGALREAGVAAVLRGPAEELPVVSWIGDLLGHTTTPYALKSQLMERLPDVGDAPPDAWGLLKSIEHDFKSVDRINLIALARRLIGGAVPAEVRGGEGRIVVSTIHRAKGLEFDNVVLVNARDLVTANADPDDCAVAYVALTRARSRIVAATQELPSFMRVDKQTKRWIVGGPKAWMTRAIEVRNADCESSDSTGAAATGVVPGSGVVAKVNPLQSDLSRPIYDLVVGSESIGRTTSRFGELVAARLGGPRQSGRPWPDITGLAVDSRATVVSLSPGSGQPPIRTGLAVSGLGGLVWEGA